MIFRESLHTLQSILVLTTTLVVSVLHGLLRVGTAHDRILSNMSSTDLFDGKRNLANSGSQLCRLDRQFKEVTLTSLSAFSDFFKSCIDSSVVSCSSNLLEALDLFLANFLVVNLKHIKVLLFFLKAVLVDTDLNLSARV